MHQRQRQVAVKALGSAVRLSGPNFAGSVSGTSAFVCVGQLVSTLRDFVRFVAFVPELLESCRSFQELSHSTVHVLFFFP